MVRKITALVLLLCLILSQQALACVGRTLYIGAIEAPEDQIMAEMLSLLINERTGTTVQIRYFKDQAALYQALKSSVEAERADILVEDTLDATTELKMQPNQFPDKDYVAVKEAYEKDLGIIWLNPFGFNNSKGKAGQSISAPLVRRDVLTNFPLLPRVLNKLAGSITNAGYAVLQEKVSGGEKPKNAARNFLKENKFI